MRVSIYVVLTQLTVVLAVSSSHALKWDKDKEINVYLVLQH